MYSKAASVENISAELLKVAKGKFCLNTLSGGMKTFKGIIWRSKINLNR